MLKNETLRRDADAIIRASLNAVLPDEAVRRALYLLTPVVAVAAAYGLKRVLKRYLPLQWKILSGGR